jgi:hypothetical protein
MKRVAILSIIVLTTLLLAIAPGCIEPTFELSNLTVSPQEVEVGQSTTISVDVIHTGGPEGTYLVILKIDGVQVDDQNVAVASGATQSASFTVTKEEPGSYIIAVNGLTKTLRVLKPAEFKTETLVVSPTEVLAGWSATVTVDVTNIGEVKDDYEVTLKVDDKAVETKKVTVAAGATETVSFTLLEDKEGTYNLSVNGLSGTLTVKEGALPTLHIGDQWVFRMIEEGTAYTMTKTVTGEEEVNGKDCYVVQVTFDPEWCGWIPERTEWWEKARPNNVILRWQFSAELEGATVTSTSRFSKATTGSPLWPMKVGNELTERVTIDKTDERLGRTITDKEEFTYRIKIEAIETITTPAGNFKCFKMVFYDGGEAINELWYSDQAKQTVKEKNLITDYSLELLSYSVKDGAL